MQFAHSSGALEGMRAEPWAPGRDDEGVDTEVVHLRTGNRLIMDISQHVVQFCRDRPHGLRRVFVPHATAGVASIETGSGSESDLEDAIDRLLPRDDVYHHRHGSRGHGRDHVLPAFVGTLAYAARDQRPPRTRYLAERGAGGHKRRPL
jgi:thiamine phosphate synthase YjbQ (UPF0047 family)